MVRTELKSIFIGALTLTSLALATGVQAAAWNLTGNGSAFSVSGGDYTYESYTPDNLTMNISGYAETGGITNTSQYLYHWSGGLGMNRNSSDDHEIDNDGPDEFIVLAFNEAVSLSGYKFGWVDNDSDSTVLRYTGAGAPAGLGAGNTISQLVSNGWAAIGDYSGTTVSTAAQTSSLYSSYWIIGSYMSAVGATDFGSGIGNSKDAFKLSAVTVSKRPPDTPPPGVPTPAPLALLIGGLFLLQQRVKKNNQ